MLDPDVVLRADAAAMRLGGAPEVRGAQAVAEAFKGRAQAARSALVDGPSAPSWRRAAGCCWCSASRSRDGRIVEIEATADPERLGQLDLAVLGD